MRKFLHFLSLFIAAFVCVPAAMAVAQPVIPATPEIKYWQNDFEAETHYTNNEIPTVDTEGNSLDINKLYYIVRHKIGDVVTIVGYDTSIYQFYNYPGQSQICVVEEIPYVANAKCSLTAVSEDEIEYAGKFVTYRTEVPDEVGLQSVYYVDGYRCFSDIFWYNTKTDETTIETLECHSKSVQGFDCTVNPPLDETVTFEQINTITVTFTNFDKIEVLGQNAIQVVQDEKYIPSSISYEEGTNVAVIQVPIYSVYADEQSGIIELHFKPKGIKGYDEEGNFEYNTENFVLSWNYEYKDSEQVLNYTTNPEEGVVNSLGVVTVTFPDYERVSIGSQPIQVPMLCNGVESKATVQNGSVKNTLDFWIQAPKYTTGEYVVKLPKGSFFVCETYIEGEDNNIEFSKSDLYMSWSLVSNADFTYDSFPWDCVVDELETIEISFPNLTSLQIANKEAITLSCDGAPVECSVEKYVGSYLYLQVVCSEKQTAPGGYTLSIPKNTLIGSSNDTDFFYNDSDIELNWTITEKGDLFYHTVNPAEGNVESLGNIEITFPSASVVFIFDENGFSLTCDGEKLPVSATSLGNVVKVMQTEEQTAAGTYVLSIAVETIALYPENSEWGNLNEDEIRLTWKIDENGGIEGITADGTAIREVYGIDGVRRDKLVKGLNIILMSDGTRRKIIVR
ncbi:MAG: hypothetical protein ACI31F_02725 [Muribaculaceae bacterium]